MTRIITAILIVSLVNCAPMYRKITTGSFEDWNTYTIETNQNPLLAFPQTPSIYVEYDQNSIAQVLQLNFTLMGMLKKYNYNLVNNKQNADLIMRINVEDESEKKSSSVPNVTSATTFGNINGIRYNSSTIGTNGFTVYNWIDKKFKIVIYAFDNKEQVYWIGQYKDDSNDIINYRNDYMLAIIKYLGVTFSGDVDILENTHKIRNEEQ